MILDPAISKKFYTIVVAVVFSFDLQWAFFGKKMENLFLKRGQRVKYS